MEGSHRACKRICFQRTARGADAACRFLPAWRLNVCIGADGSENGRGFGESSGIEKHLRPRFGHSHHASFTLTSMPTTIPHRRLQHNRSHTHAATPRHRGGPPGRSSRQTAASPRACCRCARAPPPPPPSWTACSPAR